ncbi:MAG: hypothetical protein WKF47_19385 [Geodermatophilaceae bacterium]|nr:hypothetical protein [Geodermatophilaceae bacterium]
MSERSERASGRSTLVTRRTERSEVSVSERSERASGRSTWSRGAPSAAR